MRSNFERQRCEFNARQLNDLNKSESERRREALQYYKAQRRESQGSKMIRDQANAPVLKPSPRLARGPDQMAFSQSLAQDDLKARKQNYLSDRAANDEQERSRRDFIRHDER